MSPSRHRRALALLGSFALLATASTRALAFELLGDSWPAGTDVVMHLSLSRTSTGFQDGSTSWNASAADALRIWNEHLETVRFVQAGSVPSGNGDGRNSVFFAGNIYGESFGDRTIAVTVGYNDVADPTIIAETDVIFNSNESWNSYRGPQQSDSRGKPIFDLHRVALHEFGHVLGLGHPDEAGQRVVALMNSQTDDNDSITADDIAGARHLYGPRITSPLHAVTINSGDEFSYQIRANNGATSYAASGLPEGLSLDPATGMIRGRPMQGGTFTIVVVAHGPRGSATATFQLIVAGPRITSSLGPPPVQIGDPFRYQIFAERDPTHFSTGLLPHGLNLDPATGIISGIPTLSGLHAVIVRAHTSVGDAIATVQIRVNPAPAAGEVPLARFRLPNLISMVADPVRPRVYTAEFDAVTVYDTQSLTVVKRIPISYSVAEIAISADNTKLLIATRNNYLERIDLQTLEQTSTLSVGTWAYRVREAANGRLYITDEDGGVVEVDASTGAVQRRFTPVARGPRPPNVAIELTADRKTLYVAELIDTSSPHLARYDVSGPAATLLQSVPVVGANSGSRAAVSSSGQFVTLPTNTVAEFRPGTDLSTVAGTAAVGSTALGAIAFARDDSLAFVSTRPQASGERNVISVVDLKTFQIVRTLVLQQTHSFSRMAVDSTNTHLFVHTMSYGVIEQSPMLEVYPIKLSAGPTPLPRRLLNVSTRMRTEAGDGALIGGFIITGQEPKKLALRAIGPSLPIAAKLPDPTLVLHDAAAGVVTSNENWNSHRSDVLATGLPPANEREAVIVATLPPGSYTAVVGDAEGASGVGLVELYDLSADRESKLANISTRGRVGLSDDVMIGGFIIGPDQPTRVIVRAIGPSLGASGVADALPDTAVELYDGSGTMVAANDDWREAQQQEIVDTTIPPQDDRESAVVKTLAPGNYTAVVRGKNDTSGIALVEVYNLETN